MTFDITQIILGLIGLLAAVVTALLVPWLRAKLGTTRWEQLVMVAGVAVNAAEMMYGDGKGSEKLSYALGRVNSELEKLGLAFDEETVRAAVEAAVLGLTRHEKALV